MSSKPKIALILWSIFLVLTLLACNALSGGGGNDGGDNQNNGSDDSASSADLTAFWEGINSGSDDDSSSDDSGDDSGDTVTTTPTPSDSGSGSSTPQAATQIVATNVRPDGVIELLYDRGATPASTEARVGPDLEAVKLSSPPVIDGDSSDWQTNRYAMENVVFGEGYWADKNDLSGVFQIGWDEEALYISVIVRDSRFVQTATESSIFRGDSLEVVFDTDLSGDFYSDELSSDDYQIGFSPGNLIQTTDPEAYVWYPSAISGPDARINVAGRQTANGYEMEVKLPWEVLKISPTGGERYGFVLSINDNDSIGDVQQQTVVSFGYQRTLLDPTGWFNLLLLSGK